MARKAKSKPVIMLVGVDCPPEADEAYTKWVDGKHIPEVMEFKGLKKATRFKLVDPEAEKQGYPTYLVIWEYEDEEDAKAYDASGHRPVVMEEFKKTFGNAGIQFKWRVHYQPMKTFEK